MWWTILQPMGLPPRGSFWNGRKFRIQPPTRPLRTTPSPPVSGMKTRPSVGFAAQAPAHQSGRVAFQPPGSHAAHGSRAQNAAHAANASPRAPAPQRAGGGCAASAPQGAARRRCVRKVSRTQRGGSHVKDEPQAGGLGRVWR